MAKDIVTTELPENIAKEFSVDVEGKIFVSKKGLARLCGVHVTLITRLLEGGHKNGLKTAEVQTAGGLKVVTKVPDILAADIIKHFAYQGKEQAQSTDRLLGAIGLRTFGQKLLNYQAVGKALDHPEPKKLSAHQIKIAKQMKAAGVPSTEIQLRVEGIDCFNDFREALTECDSGKFGQVRHHMDAMSIILYGKSCSQLRKDRNPDAKATPDVLSKIEQMTRNLALELTKQELEESNAGNYFECKGIVGATARAITNGIGKRKMFLQMEKSQHYRERFVDANQLNFLN